MKFLKFLLSIPYACIAGWLLWLLFNWTIPIAMGVTWGWFILYCVFAFGFVGAFFQLITSLLGIPAMWLGKENPAAKIASTIIYSIYCFSSISYLWSIMPRGLLKWIVAISFTGIILFSYIGLICTSFAADED